MTDDILAGEVELLRADFRQPEFHNVGFISERLVRLTATGWQLADIEVALRSLDVSISLVGLPLTEEMQSRFTLFHPSDTVDDAMLRFWVWIGINGQDEVDQTLAEASLSASTNLTNLAVTGFLAAKDEAADLPADPTARELLQWLIIDAPTWRARRLTVCQYLDVLNSDDVHQTLEELLDQADLDASTRGHVRAVSDFLRQAAEDPRVAIQTHEPLVLEALHAFLVKSTWAAAASLYQSYEDELSSDLAVEILLRMASEPRYSASERAVLEAHAWVLESAWERGIEAATAEAQERFPSKYGTPSAEDHLVTYLAAPELEAACDLLREAPEELLQLDYAALVAGARQADADDQVWRFGLFEDARDRGIDDAYRAWAELRSIERSTDNDQAIELLTDLAAMHQRCLRDRTLELLLAYHARVGDQAAQRRIAQELVDHRSAGSPPGRRTVDLANLGVISSQLGDRATAHDAFREAMSLVTQVQDGAARGLLRLQAGIFARDYDQDLPMAAHSFRAAAEEFRAAGDLVSNVYAIKELASLYRLLRRGATAGAYADLASRLLDDLNGTERGVVGHFADVEHSVQECLAREEFVAGDYASASTRVTWLLNESAHVLDDDDRVLLERLALACAIERRDWKSADEIVESWSVDGEADWAALGHMARTLARSATRGGHRKIKPRRTPELAGLRDTLIRLGASPADVENVLSPSTRRELARALVDTVANAQRADPLLPTRLMGDYEASAWATRSERTIMAAPAATVEPDGHSAIPLGAPWSQIIRRYDDLGVWELPDLAVLGAVLDRWSLLSRFEDAARINQAPPREGSLDVYFYRTDPEGHLDRSIRGCSYIPEGEFIVCSLPYLEELFLAGQASWEAETDQIWNALQGSDIADASRELATSLANAVRARERILLEWIIAHEIGHAHFSHSGASGGDALALESEADAFFLDGVLADEGLGEVLQSMFGQLNLLYEYDCQHQFRRRPNPAELRDRSLVLDSTPDTTGHQPLVFRAVRLVRSILEARPDLENMTFIDEFAASLEGPEGRTR